jgi:hypothetical protein
MNRPAWLNMLFENGSVAYSAANRYHLRELINLGIVSIRSAGVRRTVALSDPDQMAKWLDAHYPEHDIDPGDMPTRGGNIVRSGGSKSGRHAHDVLPLQFKWFANQKDRLTRMTKAHGIVAVLTDRLAGLPMPSKWHLLTIENWEPFYIADYAGAIDALMVVYLGGNVADSVIEAIRKLNPPPESVMHFGDYDWEGLYIFQRLQKVMPMTRLYVPEDIRALFTQFGDRKLLARQRRKAGFDMHNRECLPVIALIEQFNAGLEQEIVALPPFRNCHRPNAGSSPA